MWSTSSVTLVEASRQVPLHIYKRSTGLSGISIQHCIAINDRCHRASLHCRLLGMQYKYITVDGELQSLCGTPTVSLCGTPTFDAFSDHVELC